MTTAPVRRDAPAPTPRLHAVLRRRWLLVLLLYAASRGYSTALLGGMQLLATAAGWHFAGTRGAPSFATFSGSWDGWFYRSIAEHGYPAVLPVDAAGRVLPNEWAFLPVFPVLERVLTAATGMPTYAAGALIAAAAGGGAAVVLDRLLVPHVGERRALSAVALVVLGPLGFLLQVAYAEGVFLLLLWGALLALQRGRPLLATPIVVVAAFTRPGALAVPVAMLGLLAVRTLRDRRLPPVALRTVLAAAVMLAAGLAWPLIADAVTGRRGAYLDTELSWWTGWVGYPDFVPFTPWLLITSRWLGPAGVVGAGLLIAAAGRWILRGSPSRLGGTIRCFAAAYALYLVAVFLPQFSLPRLLLPLAPLLGAAAFTGTAVRRRRWLVAGAALQPVLVVLLWFLGYP